MNTMQAIQLKWIFYSIILSQMVAGHSELLVRMHCN